jgi:hypothetical protein
MTERLQGNLRELSFYGEGIAENIKRGFAITSLRNPRAAYEFFPGEVILANCSDDGEKVPVMVINNIETRLNKLPIPILALDGFFSAEIATRRMREYPGYENTTPRTILQAITFIDQESFTSLSPELQNSLLKDGFMDSMKMKELRRIFFPTMAKHFSHFGEVDEWLNFLTENSLITTEEKLKIESFEINFTNVFNLLKRHPEAFQKLAQDRSQRSPMFTPIILGIID